MKYGSIVAVIIRLAMSHCQALDPCTRVGGMRISLSTLSLTLFTLTSCAQVSSELRYKPETKFPGQACLEFPEVIILGDFDTTEIARAQARRGGENSLGEAFDDFIRDGLNDKKGHDLRLCVDLKHGEVYENKILIDTLIIIKNYPGDPLSNVNRRGHLVFTYHSGYSANAELHFRINDDSINGSGVIRYEGKIVGNDWNDARGAVRMMVRRLVDDVFSKK